jgi:serine phosphatase RsbU (regulator of sigma subunit)
VGVPDGGVRSVELARSIPLGAGADERVCTTIPLRAGETVLLYTDGLVERRVEDIDAGLDRLRSAAPALAGGDLTSALRSVVEGLHDEARDDDVTALAVRRLAGPAGV